MGWQIRGQHGVAVMRKPAAVQGPGGVVKPGPMQKHDGRLRAVEFWNLNSARRYETGFSWGYCFLPGRIRCGLRSAGGGWQTVPEKTQADTDFLTCKREKGNNRADSCNRGLAVSQIPGLALPAPISSVQDHFSKFLQWRPSFSIRSSASFGPHVPAV